MKLTPLSIKQQQFNKSMRGYNKDEVQLYLERLSDEFERMQSENEKNKRELEEAREKLAEYHKIEKNLQETLLKAYESSNKAVETAKKQTALMTKEAEIKASQIVDKAKESADSIRNAVLNLREEKNIILARLKALVNSQANLLEVKLVAADKEPEPVQKISNPGAVDIDIDNIVDKLL